MRKILIALFSFVLLSCSSYVEKWHSKIDSIERGKKSGIRERIYGPTGHFKKDQSHLNKNLGHKFYSTEGTKHLAPHYKRRYGRETKRRTIDSLYDNGNEDSLWSGVGQENYLFTRNNIKKYGDIIIVDMGFDLKREIMLEFSRVYPSTKFSLDGKKKSIDEELLKEKDERKIYGRVSSVIIEEMNKDHLLIQGKKEMLYKDKKRVIEIQALVARRDISRTDTIHSDKILELMVSVVR